MRRALLAITCLVLFPWAAAAQTPRPFSFQVPAMAEAGGFFAVVDHLERLDAGAVELDTEWLAEAYDGCLVSNELAALAFAAYVRQTGNDVVRRALQASIDGRSLSDPLSQVLRRLHQSVSTTVQTQTGPFTRRSYHGERFDEGIDLFHVAEYHVFGGQLAVSVPANPWIQLQFADRSDPDGGPDPNAVALQMPVGPTHSMSIVLNRKTALDDAAFRVFAAESTIKARCGSSVLQEVTGQGVFANANSDLVYIETGAGPDTASGVEQAMARLSLYSRALKTGYSAEWYMNLSPANNNWEIRDRLWTHMTLLATLTYIL